MATITKSANPVTVVLPDTSENVLMFDASVLKGRVDDITSAILVTVGTVNFNTTGGNAASGASYTVGDKFILTFSPTVGIAVKATSTSDAFKISF